MPLFRRCLIASFLLTLAPACSRHEAAPPSKQSPDDAGTSARAVLATIAHASPFAEHVGSGLALSSTSTGYRPAAGLAEGDLDATLPRGLASPARVGVVGRAALWVELSPLGLSERVGQVIEGAVVYRDAAPDTDVVWVAESKRLEELRVLRSDRASTHARYRIARGADVANVRVRAQVRTGADAEAEREDVLEVVDARGEVRLTSAPMFAIDARGVRRGVRADVRSTDDGLELHTSFDARGLTYPIIVDPAWTTVSPMSSARTGHTATALPGDSVLVVGGNDGSGKTLSSGELYDPSAHTFTATPSMSTARSGHTATLLSAGRVLVVGGGNTSKPYLSTAEIYDATTKTWSAAASMSEVRAFHTATLLSGDRVLVTGGANGPAGGNSNTAEIYDPAANKWTSAGSMSVYRQEHAAALLPSGKVIVTGGGNGGGVMHSEADLFDPSTGAWSTLPPMTTTRTRHTATALSGDRVLVAGGMQFDKFSTLQTLSTAELYDPASKTWTATRPMATVRSQHTATGLPQDRVLVVGGGSTGVELYQYSTTHFTAFPPLGTARASHAAALLSNTDVLVTGGSSTSPALSGAELFHMGAPGDSCTNGELDCGSGLCVDGVCCNSACTGPCEACDVAGSKGTCTPVTGAPHGSRAPCSDGAGAACAARHCDGADRTQCAGYADTSTTCAVAVCKSGAASVAAMCDGKGGCSSVTPVSCAPYACGGSICKTSCKVDADCAGSNVCDVTTGHCIVATPSTCTPDGLSSQPIDHSTSPKACSPYRCDGTSGKCFDKCKTTDQCAPGAVCDAPSGACVTATQSSSQGGCAAAGMSGGKTPTLVLGAVWLGLLVRARRRRRISDRTRTFVAREDT